MSTENTTTPVTETPATQAKTRKQEILEEFKDVTAVVLNGATYPVELNVVKQRSKDEYDLNVLPKLPLESAVSILLSKLDTEQARVFTQAVLRELVHPAAVAASAKAIGLDANGEATFDMAKYEEAFWAEFQAPSRAGGISKKELADKQAALTPRYMELAGIVVQAGATGQEVDEAIVLEFFNLHKQIQEITAKLEEKSRGGKVSKKKAKAAPAAAAPAEPVAA